MFYPRRILATMALEADADRRATLEPVSTRADPDELDEELDELIPFRRGRVDRSRALSDASLFIPLAAL